MVRRTSNAEYFLVRKVADEYRDQGYEVSVDAPLDFLPGFRADVIARKGGETKVIEVKSRSSLGQNPKVVELAQTIDGKPGWSFELVVVAEPEKVESLQSAQPFTREVITQRIKEAENALASGFSEAAFLLAWSACEASVRDLVATEDKVDLQVTTPEYILKQAVFQGLLPHDDYEELKSLQKYRNAIVHGFTVEQFTDELTMQLIETVRRMETAKTQQSNESG